MPRATKKKSKPTQSIPEIHDDVVLQILLRLPLKPLLRFKSVSKSWNQMIMHEDSMDLYHTRCKEAKHSSDSESLFIINKYDQCYVSKMPELDEAVEAFSLRRVMKGHDYDVCEKLLDWVRDWGDLRIYPIVGSSNGVVCIFKNGKLVLSNVITRTHRFVKCLAIEESKKSAEVAFGFGYDRRSYDYKIVRIVFERVRDSSNFMPSNTRVYSLNYDSWRSVGACTILNLSSFMVCKLVFVNSAVHCVAVTLEGKYTIVSFDIHDENWGQVPLPSDFNGRQVQCSSLLRLSDCLCLVVWGNHRCFIWMMNEYGVKESWNMISQISPEMRSIPSIFMKATETWFLAWNFKLMRHDSRDNSIDEAFSGLSPKDVILVANVPVTLSVKSKQSVKSKPPIAG